MPAWIYSTYLLLVQNLAAGKGGVILSLALVLAWHGTTCAPFISWHFIIVCATITLRNLPGLRHNYIFARRYNQTFVKIFFLIENCQVATCHTVSMAIWT